MLLVSVVNVSIRNEFDSILHSFVECEEAKSFFDEVISLFNKTNNSPTMAEKLFGMLHNGNDKQLPKFNHCLLFAKHFLYCQKIS